MSCEASQKRVSRAAVLRTAAVGAVGAAGVMLADAPAADATTIDSDYIAQNNGSSDLPTGYITTNGSGGHGYDTGGQFQGTTVGVYGSSDSGNGVIGSSGGAAGDLGAAVRAFSTGNGDGVWASAGTDGGVGVHGENFADGDGVYGVSDGSGAGVHGVSNGGAAVRAEDASEDATGTGLLATTHAGTAVSASATTGTALSVSGRAAYSNCGAATVAGTVATPKQAVTFKGAALTTHSIVLATLQANVAGVFVASAVPHVAGGTVTINLNQPVSQHVKVGWFVCDLIPVNPV